MQKFDQLLKQNATANEIDQLPRQEFAIDELAISTLKAAGKGRVAAIRETLRRGNMRKGVIWQRIMDHSQANLLSPIRGLVGVRTDNLVHSFAVTQTNAERAKLSKVTFLRRVELIECRLTARPCRQAEMTITIDADGHPVTDTTVDFDPYAFDANAEATSKTSIEQYVALFTV